MADPEKTGWVSREELRSADGNGLGGGTSAKGATVTQTQRAHGFSLPDRELAIPRDRRRKRREARLMLFGKCDRDQGALLLGNLPREAPQREGAMSSLRYKVFSR